MRDLFRLIVSTIWGRWHPLVDRGFGLVYDVERNITWLQDANYARTAGKSPDGQLTWDAAMSWTAALSYKDVVGWRLPTALNQDGSGPCNGTNCAGSEIGHVVLGAWRADPGFIKYRNFNAYGVYWTSTQASADEAYAFAFYSVRQATLSKNPFTGGDFPPLPLLGPVLAWPVHDGDVAPEVALRYFRRLLTAMIQVFTR